MAFDLKKTFSDVRSRFKEVPVGKREGILLERDWAIVALSFIVASLFAISFGGYVFYKTVTDDFLGFSEGEVVTPKTVSRARLNAAVERVDKEIRTLEELKRARPATPTP